MNDFSLDYSVDDDADSIGIDFEDSDSCDVVCACENDDVEDGFGGEEDDVADFSDVSCDDFSDDNLLDDIIIGLGDDLSAE